jgi:two-component system cell cycle sensor histidine kinase/response regulator CckA
MTGLIATLAAAAAGLVGAVLVAPVHGLLPALLLLCLSLAGAAAALHLLVLKPAAADRRRAGEAAAALAALAEDAVPAALVARDGAVIAASLGWRRWLAGPAEPRAALEASGLDRDAADRLHIELLQESTRAGVGEAGLPALDGIARAVSVRGIAQAEGARLWRIADAAPSGALAGPAMPAGEAPPLMAFATALEAAPVGMLALDGAGVIQLANHAARRFLSAAEPIGQRFDELLRPEDRKAFAERLRRAGSAAGEIEPPLEARLASGPDRVAHLFLSRLGEAGEGALLHIIDVSEQKALEGRFAQGQKMQAVGQLAGGIAHDFNNLLTAMIGFCDLLLLRHPPGDQSFADVMQIKQNASRAANLVRQLLAFSRQQTLRPRVLDLTDVLADLRNLLSRLIGETIELKMVHGRDLGLVKVDQGQFEQVVINLAVNARDAMLEFGGVLTIRTANALLTEPLELTPEPVPPGDWVMVEVVDTGKGIQPENLTKIFEPFFTTKEVGAGTGLGLSTCYGIIKQTGGVIGVESRLNDGAAFRIFLPRHRQQAGETVAPVDEGRRDSRDLTGRGTILLVEDEDAVRTFAARALRNKGYIVLEASSGEGALSLAAEQTQPIDVLVSDVVMPAMDGPTLARRILTERPDIKIILISGYAEDAFRRGKDLEFKFTFLPKPFSLSQLASRVKDVQEGRY